MKKLLTLFVLLISISTFSQEKVEITPGFYYGFINERNAKYKYLIKVREDGVVDRMKIKKGVKGQGSITTDAFKDYEYKKTVSVGGVITMEYIRYDENTEVTTLHKFIIAKVRLDTLKIFHLKFHLKNGEEGSSYYYGGDGLFSRDVKGYIKDARYD